MSLRDLQGLHCGQDEFTFQQQYHDMEFSRPRRLAAYSNTVSQSKDDDSESDQVSEAASTPPPSKKRKATTRLQDTTKDTSEARLVNQNVDSPQNGYESPGSPLSSVPSDSEENENEYLPTPKSQNNKKKTTKKITSPTPRRTPVPRRQSHILKLKVRFPTLAAAGLTTITGGVATNTRELVGLNDEYTPKKDQDQPLFSQPSTPIQAKERAQKDAQKTSIVRPSSRDFPTPDSQDEEIIHPTLFELGDDVPLGEALDNIEWCRISQGLVGLSAISPKPEPVGQPLVWADTRADLCESLIYFRSFQSGCYMKDYRVQGFMFDGESHPRDYLDPDVSISRAGGCLGKNKETGVMEMIKDQDETKRQVQSVLNNIEQRNPIAIISGQSNSTMHSKMPYVYNVLGWFKPTHVWSEKSRGFIIQRYRLEKLKKDEPSWWAPQGVEYPLKLGDLPAPFSQQCRQCCKTSLQVYLNGWMCLRSHCPLFWMLTTGQEPEESLLCYDPRFLKQHTPWRHSAEPFATKPNPHDLKDSGILGHDAFRDLAWEATRGMCCPNCGRCGARYKWAVWECPCGHKLDLPHAEVPPTALYDFYNPITANYSFSRDWSDPCIPVSTDFIGNYRVHKYEIPGAGFVAHMIANKTVNEEAGGPNDMFKELQTKEFGLLRRILGGKKTEKSPEKGGSTLKGTSAEKGESPESGKVVEKETAFAKGKSFTKHFSVNFGVGYNYIVDQDSLPFEEAPEAVRSARTRLNWAQKILAKDDHAEFNECLVIGYMEKHSMNYHDDGETGLGPTITTLSLGGDAVMKLRMRQQDYYGIAKRGRYLDAEPVPLSHLYEKRKAAWEELEKLGKNTPARAARLEQLPNELGLQSGKNRSEVLRMHLSHGDIIMMHGEKLQGPWQHTVEPLGRVRFALTCRHIKPEENGKITSFPVLPDQNTYDGLLLSMPPQEIV